MQLPRGAFRDIKKGIGLESLLAELNEESFSGYCKIATDKAAATLVLKEGVIILARSGDHRGDAALAAMGKWRDEEVNAVLHTLSDAQLDLTLEFNPADRVQETHPIQFPRRSVKEVPRPPPPVRATDMDPPVLPRSRHQEPDLRAHQTLSPVLQEFNTLDGMDIENMSRTFRENCRQIIEKLDLGFLLESEKQKGGP